MNKVKILHIIKSLGRGGAEMLLPQTLNLHNKERFKFHYIYFLPWKDHMVEEIVRGGGKVTCFEATNNLQLLRQVDKVVAYCKEEEIDLIHCHLPWSGFLGRLVHRRTAIPTIYTEHNIQERYHPMTKWLNKFSFNSQSLALGVSEDVTRSIKKIIHPSIRVETLLNGVNTDFFRRNVEKGLEIRKKYGIPIDVPVIGNIAVFREQKDLPTWVRAFKKVTEEHEVFGILVGAGPKEEEIKLLIRELKLEGRLKLPGLKTNTVNFFSAMDIFLMTSSFEGLPIALLEAMSMGCGIVSTKAGGVTEAVRNEVEGLLCEVGDWPCLSEKVSLLLENSKKLSQYQHAAQQRVQERFSLDRMVKTLEKEYLQLLEEV